MELDLEVVFGSREWGLRVACWRSSVVTQPACPCGTRSIGQLLGHLAGDGHREGNVWEKRNKLQFTLYLSALMFDGL